MAEIAKSVISSADNSFYSITNSKVRIWLLENKLGFQKGHFKQ